jgi:hypothetical protein
LWDNLTDSVLPIRINQILNKPDHCRFKGHYPHIHAVHGSNRSMDSGLVLGCFGRYFTRPDEFAVLCDQAEAGPEAAVRRGRAQVASLDRYEWGTVSRTSTRNSQSG